MSNPATPTPRLGRLARWLGIYRSVAVILLNLILLATFFNFGLYVVFLFRGPDPGMASAKPPSFPEASFARVYPDMSPTERDLMLREVWTRPFVYRDYVLFKERPIDGKYVKVSEVGFRHVKNQGPWPPAPTNLNVFVFGGSTTFGYGVPDEQTIPSYIQEGLSARSKKRVCIYNFGAGWYYSTQERILFERMLTDGFVPHIALFIDGFNDTHSYYDRLPFSHRFGELFDDVNTPGFGRLVKSVVGRTPTGRAIRGLRGRLAARKNGDTQKQVEQALQKYLKNKELIEALCRQFNISPVFIWQPVPGYKYDLKYHLFAGRQIDFNLAYGYSEMAKLPVERLGSHFIWAADLQENEKECLYVDANHYTAKFCKQIADFITQTVTQRKLFVVHGIKPAASSAPGAGSILEQRVDERRGAGAAEDDQYAEAQHEQD